MIWFVDTITGDKTETAFRTLTGITRHRKDIINRVILNAENVLILNMLEGDVWCYLDDEEVNLKLKK